MCMVTVNDIITENIVNIYIARSLIDLRTAPKLGLLVYLARHHRKFW